MSDPFLKPFIVYSVMFLFLVSCATVVIEKRKGTGRPKFSSLKIDGLTYELNSEGKYTPSEPLKLFLKIKNTGQSTRTFEINDNRLAGINVENEYSEKVISVGIKADEHVRGGKLRLAPGAGRSFEFEINTTDPGFEEASIISATVRLLFLPKKFRRNSLSVYVEKEN